MSRPAVVEALQALIDAVLEDDMAGAQQIARHGAKDALASLERDAARYRWLRAQHWSTAPLCVVSDPKDAVKLGRTCPSGEYLDIEVDAAIDAAQGQGDGRG
jgi:muconolactone delta-isomerase